MKKRILLVSFYDRICLSTRSLSAQLKKYGYDPYLIFLKDDRGKVIEDLNPNNVQYQHLRLNRFLGWGSDVNPVSEVELSLFDDLIKEIRPDTVGISSRSMHLGLAKDVASRVRHEVPQATIVAGGYGPTIDPVGFLDACDWVILGEGDEAFIRFLDSTDPKAAPNVAYMEKGKLCCNPMLQPADLDALPFPDWDTDNKYMIEDDQLKSGSNFYDPRTYDIFASRGCISSCSYCLACQWTRMLKRYGSSFPKIRFRSPQSVIEELIYAKSEYGIDFVRFKDSIFAVDAKWLTEFVNLYEKHIGLRINCLLDERFVDEKKIQLLCNVGLHDTTVGIQSSNEGIRRNVFNRQISDEGVIEYAEMLTRHNIEIKYDLINWNPFETEETLDQGRKFLKRLPKSTEISTTQLMMFPGTPIYERFIREHPHQLPSDRYTFWTVIHSMTLYSKESEALADKLVGRPGITYHDLLERYSRIIQKQGSDHVIFANTDIERGKKITNVMLSYKKCESIGEHIPFAEFLNILNTVAAADIKAGTLLKWGHLQLGYDHGGNDGQSAVV